MINEVTPEPIGCGNLIFSTTRAEQVLHLLNLQRFASITRRCVDTPKEGRLYHGADRSSRMLADLSLICSKELPLVLSALTIRDFIPSDRKIAFRGWLLYYL